jgi:tRNA dimethylallyltransferase
VTAGYKEFSVYLDAIEKDERDFVDEEKLFRAALAEMQLGTRQYARRQIKWIRNKLIPAVHEQSGDVCVYLLNATGEGNLSRICLRSRPGADGDSDLSGWNEEVKEMAVDLTQGGL